ncbi:MAG: glycoside hydrolase family 5 protein, partial [Planctomycetota bacterium]
MTMTKLRAEGAEIVDETGSPVMLRGVGIGMWHLAEGYMFGSVESPYSSPRGMAALTTELIGPKASADFWSRWREACYTEADAQAIAAAGCNSVRFALDWQHLFTDEEEPKPIEEGLALIDRAVAFSKAAGLWVILDLHAAPGGQNGTNIDNGWGWPWLFESDHCWKQTVSIWRQLAQRYGADPAVAGYDLLNEPLPEAYRDRYYDKLPALYRDIIAAIRSVDSQTLVILEGANWSTDYSM